MNPGPKKPIVTMESRTSVLPVLKDGELVRSTVGTTEHTAELPPGTHELELELPGFENLTKTVTIEPGKPETLNFTMAPGFSDSAKSWRTFQQAAKWSLTGLAAAATAVWVWQGTRARSLDEEAESYQIDSAKFRETADSAETSALVSDVSMVTALLAAGGATYF